jgi:hypothetical protein
LGYLRFSASGALAVRMGSILWVVAVSFIGDSK